MSGSRLALTEPERLRVARIDELAVVGAPAVPELMEAIADPSWAVRRAAVAVLAIFADEAVPALVAWLRDERTTERTIAAVVDALVGSLGATTAEAVGALATHPDPAIVADVATILGRRRARTAIPLLATLLSHADDNVAVAAIEALGAMGEAAAIEALVTLVRRREFFRTFAAVQVLARSGDPRAIHPLVELLDEELYRQEAISGLGRTGAAQAVPALAALLAAAEPHEARSIAVALDELVARARWQGADAHAIEVMRAALSPHTSILVRALTGGTAIERTALARVLGHVGDETAITALVDLVAEPGEEGTGQAAARAIRDLGQRHEAALLDAMVGGDAAARAALLPGVRSAAAAATVRGLLTDRDPDVRALACDALARIGHTDAVPQLFGLLGDSNPRVVHAATAAIHSLGTKETPGLALAALASLKPAVRKQALRILAYVGPPEAYGPVLALTADADPRISELAVAALGALADSRTDDALGTLAASTSAPVRAATLRAASQRGGEHMLRLLEGGLTDDDAWVRYYACQGLGRLGPGVVSGATTDRLVARLGDATPQVRVSAIEALARIGSDSAWYALASAAQSTDADERRAALVGVATARHSRATALLLAAVAVDDMPTQLIALDGLARLDDAGALEAVEAAAAGSVIELRDAAVSLLAARGDRRAIEMLADVAQTVPLDHPAHLALSQSSDEQTRSLAPRVAVLAERLVDPARSSAAPILAAALARMHSPAATAALFGALAAAVPAVRRAAAITLAGIAADGARAAVARLAATDPDPEVRRVAAAAIES